MQLQRNDHSPEKDRKGKNICSKAAHTIQQVYP